jgi:hypothetical protein
MTTSSAAGDKAKSDLADLIEGELEYILRHHAEELSSAILDAGYRKFGHIQEGLAEAWDEGADAECYSATHELIVNPYRSSTK